MYKHAMKLIGKTYYLRKVYENIYYLGSFFKVIELFVVLFNSYPKA